MHLNFAEWSDEEEGLLIPKAWINIFRIPKKLRELLVIWALATNNSSFGRVLVSVIDSKAFPRKLTVVIGDRWYEFSIKVESIIPEVESYVEEIKNNDDSKRRDDDALGESSNKDNSDTRKKPKNCRNASQTGADEGRMDVDTNKNSSGNKNQRQITEEQLRVMANGILDLVADNLLEEIAGKVAAEVDDNEFMTDQCMLDSHAPEVEKELDGQETVGTQLREKLQLLVSATELQNNVEQGSGGVGVDCPAKQVSTTPFYGATGMTPPNRTSKRRANSLDEHSLERAERMVAKRNLETLEGTQKNISFLSLSEDRISTNISNIGVLMCTNGDRVKKATKHITLMETHRLATSPIKNSKVKRDLTKDLDDKHMMMMMVWINYLCATFVIIFWKIAWLTIIVT
ncbi:hypothetical protein HU200_035807 [Digitaria exilis]|uniref:DUF4283 domain-containing protein n=1 Tax=Digitaria exilis TaxID=1010633 RepID=A0A835BHQ4_9POAL|nr:hypothetical protein HU200_035807 [Digitaria exilis]